MSYIPPYIAQLLSRQRNMGSSLDGLARDGELSVAIRLSRDADLPYLYDLAELDSRRPLLGPVLVGMIDGEPWAALSLRDGGVIANPFRPSAATVELLRMRAGQLEAAERANRRRKRLPTLLRRARA